MKLNESDSVKLPLGHMFAADFLTPIGARGAGDRRAPQLGQKNMASVRFIRGCPPNEAVRGSSCQLAEISADCGNRRLWWAAVKLYVLRAFWKSQRS